MKIIKQLSIFLFSITLSLQSFGWGQIGHRVVGEIGNSYLTSKARKAVEKILGTESMAIASTWADEFARSDSSLSFTTPWHFINLKDGLTNADLVKWLQTDTGTDVNTKLNYLVKELKNSQATADQKRFCLRMLIHLVGDIHQPLHVGGESTKGGNTIKVLWFSTPTNLHSVWDTQLVDYQKLSYTEYTKSINHPTKAQITEWQSQPISDWFIESYRLSTQICSAITKPDQKLEYRYNFDYIQILNTRLLQAGVRLAGLLNEIYG